MYKSDDYPPIIGLCGDIGSGKDTAAEGLEQGLGYMRLSFAEKLKESVATMFPFIPRCHFFGTQEEKAQLLFVGDDGTEWTGRRLLEDVGQHMRGIMADIWVRAAIYQVKMNPLIEWWVVSDVRHPNEFEAIRRHGGVVWEVVRVGGAEAEQSDHVSDNAWRAERKDATLRVKSGDVRGLREAACRLAIDGGRR